MRMSKCCDKVAVKSNRRLSSTENEMQWFCGGVDGCGNWCETYLAVPQDDVKDSKDSTNYFKGFNDGVATENTRIKEKITNSAEQVIEEYRNIANEDRIYSYKDIMQIMIQMSKLL